MPNYFRIVRSFLLSEWHIMPVVIMQKASKKKTRVKQLNIVRRQNVRTIHTQTILFFTQSCSQCLADLKTSFDLVAGLWVTLSTSIIRPHVVAFFWNFFLDNFQTVSESMNWNSVEWCPIDRRSYDFIFYFTNFA